MSEDFNDFTTTMDNSPTNNCLTNGEDSNNEDSDNDDHVYVDSMPLAIESFEGVGDVDIYSNQRELESCSMDGVNKQTDFLRVHSDDLHIHVVDEIGQCLQQELFFDVVLHVWDDYEENNSTIEERDGDSNKVRDSAISSDVLSDNKCKMLHAHRVVLAAVSPFFQQIFEPFDDKVHEEPLNLVLTGVHMNDLRALLNIIYYGNVEATITELKRIIQLARYLKVMIPLSNNLLQALGIKHEGIVEYSGDMEETIVNNTQIKENTNSDQDPPSTDHMLKATLATQGSSQEELNLKRRLDNLSTIVSRKQRKMNVSSMNGEVSSVNSHLLQNLNCSQCNLTFNSVVRYRCHMEQFHEDESIKEFKNKMMSDIVTLCFNPLTSVYTCQFCNSTYAHGGNFKQHIGKHERETGCISKAYNDGYRGPSSKMNVSSYLPQKKEKAVNVTSPTVKTETSNSHRITPVVALSPLQHSLQNIQPALSVDQNITVTGLAPISASGSLPLPCSDQKKSATLERHILTLMMLSKQQQQNQQEGINLNQDNIASFPAQFPSTSVHPLPQHTSLSSQKQQLTNMMLLSSGNSDLQQSQIAVLEQLRKRLVAVQSNSSNQSLSNFASATGGVVVTSSKPSTTEPIPLPNSAMKQSHSSTKTEASKNEKSPKVTNSLSFNAHTCPICCRSFSHFGNYKQHMSSHVRAAMNSATARGDSEQVMQLLQVNKEWLDADARNALHTLRTHLLTNSGIVSASDMDDLQGTSYQKTAGEDNHGLNEEITNYISSSMMESEESKQQLESQIVSFGQVRQQQKLKHKARIQSKAEMTLISSVMSNVNNNTADSTQSTSKDCDMGNSPPLIVSHSAVGGNTRGESPINEQCPHPNCFETFRKRGWLVKHIAKCHPELATQFSFNSYPVAISGVNNVSKNVSIMTALKDAAAVVASTVAASNSKFASNAEQLKCVTCGARFETSSDLKVHMLTKHRNPERLGMLFPEPTNDELSTPSPSSVSGTTSGGEESGCASGSSSGLTRFRFECDICGKRFTRPHHVRRHKLLHSTQQENFDCSKCGVSFPQEDTLKAHQLRFCTGSNFNADFINRNTGGVSQTIKNMEQEGGVIIHGDDIGNDYDEGENTFQDEGRGMDNTPRQTTNLKENKQLSI